MTAPNAPARARLLVVTNVLPDGTTSAGEQRLIRLCRILLDSFEVTLIATSRTSAVDTRARARALVDLGLLVPQAGLSSRWWPAVARRRFDGVLIEFWHVASEALPAIRRWQPRARVVIDTVDLEFLRDARGTFFTHGRPAESLTARKQLELSTYESCDGLIFVSAVEQATYRASKDLPSTTWLVPILVELRTRSDGPRTPVVVFVANYWHAPNVDGIVWFCEQVWPLVRDGVPDAVLQIVGANLWEEVAKLAAVAGVDVVGFAEDLDDVYDNAAVAIAPLRYGAGMKGKVCEALAAAVPVVTTTIGVEGIQVQAGRDLLVADCPTEMAAAIMGLLADAATAARIGSAGQEAIARQCLPEASRPVVTDLATFLHIPSQPPSRRWVARIVASIWQRGVVRVPRGDRFRR